LKQKIDNFATKKITFGGQNSNHHRKSENNYYTPIFALSDTKLTILPQKITFGAKKTIFMHIVLSVPLLSSMDPWAKGFLIRCSGLPEAQ
jgi:hypothetical protein